MLKIGDFVTRKSYNNDLLFVIVDIVSDVAYLKGIDVRLYADSNLDDLVLVDDVENDNILNADRSEALKFKICLLWIEMNIFIYQGKFFKLMAIVII